MPPLVVWAGRSLMALTNPRAAVPVSGVEPSGYNGASPAPNTGQHGHVLLAVRATVGNRPPDNARTSIEPPEFLTGACMYRLEPPLHRAVEDHPTRRGHGAAPDGKCFLDTPHLFCGNGLPRGQCATMPPWAGVHLHIGAHEGRAGNIADLNFFPIHTEVIVRNVEEACLRREGRGLPIFGFLSSA